MKKTIKNIALSIAVNLMTFSYAFAGAAGDGCTGEGEFRSVISGDCISTYEEWIVEVWGWAMGILVGLSVLILAAAGVIYMTSEGDSNRIGIAKKMIIGVVSGVGLLVLARLLLFIIFGQEGVDLWWNVGEETTQLLRHLWIG
ncbi:MAG: hypothetical protein PHW75_01720 [Patescibacteria group bacterium]|nr:hypothetical protein [Patescibacteria group bacterium]